MDYFKRIFFFQLKWLPILGLTVFIIGSIVYELYKKSEQDHSEYKTLSKNEFFEIAIKNKVSDFEKYDRYMKMELPNNGKYKWMLRHAGDEEELEDTISKVCFEYSIYEHYSEYEESYYQIAIPAILSVIFWILIFNLVIVLWFFALFDLMQSEFTENHNKWMWLVCLLIVPFIAPAFYWIISGKQKKTTE